MWRYLLLLPLSIAMTMLAHALAPVLPLFATNGWLPKWLWWFQTPDNPLFGDRGHWERWMYKSRYWQQVVWLWRNPVYGFEWDGPLAAKITEESKTELFAVWGDPWIKNRDNAKAGWYYCELDKYWNFKAVIPLWGDLAFMPEFGWKLQGFAQGRETEGKAMYAFSLRLTAFYPEKIGD